MRQQTGIRRTEMPLPELFCDNSMTTLNILSNLDGEKVPFVFQNLRVLEIYLLRAIIQLLLEKLKVEL